MLKRALAREECDEKKIERFEKCGIKTYRQLIQRSSWDVANVVDMSVMDLEELIQKVSVRLAPPSRTALEMFLESTNHPVFLRTELPQLDTALCGGLSAGSLTELAGTAGIGKTQLAMSLAISCVLQYPEATVLYFDPDQSFSAKRILQIVTERIQKRTLNHSETTKQMIVKAVERVRLVQVNSMEDLLKQLKNLESYISFMNIKLLVIDSITTLVLKKSTESSTLTRRYHHLQKIVRELKLFADTYKAFVVVNNQASTVESDVGAFTRPALGDAWFHCVTTRLVLERYAHYRGISVVKSPLSGYIMQPYEIQAAGVIPFEDQNVVMDISGFDAHDDIMEKMVLAALPVVQLSNTIASSQSSTQTQLNTTELSLCEDEYVSDSNEEDDEEDSELAIAALGET